MSTKFIEIVRLLLLHYIISRNCESSPSQLELSEEVTNSKDQYRSPRTIRPFTSIPQASDNTSAPSSTDSGQLLDELTINDIKHLIWKIYQYQDTDLKSTKSQTDETQKPLCERERMVIRKVQKISDVDIDYKIGVPPEIDTNSNREQDYVRVAQSEISQETDERDSPDLSFLDDLGSLDSILPNLENASVTNEEAPANVNSTTNSDNFVQHFVSKLITIIKKDEKLAAVFKTNFSESTFRFGIISLQKRLVEMEVPHADIYYLLRGSYRIVKASADYDFRSRSKTITEVDFWNETFIVALNIPFNCTHVFSIALSYNYNHLNNAKDSPVQTSTDNPLNDTMPIIYSGYSRVNKQ